MTFGANSHLVVVLGHTNDDQGLLSETALARCTAAVELLKSDPRSVFVCTGAFGDNFNRSATPHSSLLAQHIISSGVAPDRFVGGTNSSNTVEDALSVLRDYSGSHSKITVVTSPFHAERAKYIFSRLLWDKHIEFAVSEATPSDEPISREREKLRRERRVIPVLASANLRAASTETLSMLGDELRHYDILSYYPLLAIGGLLWVFFQYPMQTAHLEAAGIATTLFLCSLLLHLYWRFADTARTCRRLIQGACFYFSVPALAGRAGQGLGARWIIVILVAAMFTAVVLGRPHAAENRQHRSREASQSEISLDWRRLIYFSARPMLCGEECRRDV